jgi:hypothetical protein
LLFSFSFFFFNSSVTTICSTTCSSGRLLSFFFSFFLFLLALWLPSARIPALLVDCVLFAFFLFLFCLPFDYHMPETCSSGRYTLNLNPKPKSKHWHNLALNIGTTFAKTSASLRKPKPWP